jgi:hypothetical protein
MYPKGSCEVVGLPSYHRRRRRSPTGTASIVLGTPPLLLRLVRRFLLSALGGEDTVRILVTVYYDHSRC